ncbi:MULTISPECIES: tail fiber assembly protein [Pseudomonas]|uniref:Phage-like protein, Tail fiber assembly protein n=1 Tax=Pseudomonas chlororaphis TaxID=587753 RepID=A0AAX3G4W9_9PSED|nr:MULTISPECIES: tail fiber assembly protein [Pseudomonas]AZC35670.1 Putative tail fiber assembly protein p37 [Pseudomonas chlororaphis subsp. piscium]AZC42212.1 Putative tail fiber assembly protein p37 [Pseudomonas chlororaphis subsp. piscium]AZC48874.1 Putative tail fiber assembly protein p37 [Pseudomonas chlororaphis subsp. piscium]AZC55493.1 Putative tail fiber assembly protein p37 [Pseudomonas chlororaphis subsp. piscium]AZC61762.1 Putative tail fiber assembly protein p37 [Pseudomonas chl
MMNYLIDASGALIGPVEFPLIPGLGIQLPNNAIILEQQLDDPAPGHVWAFLGGQPQQVVDLRGTAYSVGTGEPVEWSELGDLPEGLTKTAPPGQYFNWREDSWQLDVKAQQAAAALGAQSERDKRLGEAALRMAPLQYALELGEASSEEQSALLEWKRYCVALNRIEQQPGYPFEVEWPVLNLEAPRGPLKTLRSFFRSK